MEPLRIAEQFTTLYGNRPLVVRSPGRINLIGEHTDYNDGFVMPAAIDKAIVFAVAPNGSSRMRCFAEDYHDRFETELTDLKLDPRGWPNYLMGVVDQFMNRGYALGGFDCFFAGDVPIGSGMSSSAAVEGGLGLALNEVFHLGFDRMELARLGQRAENQFVGMNCGIMDQFANLMGKEGQLIELDCRSMDYSYHPFDNEHYSLVLCDSQVKHSHTTSAYNLRREQCAAAVEGIRKKYHEVNSLRDATPEMLAESKETLDPIVFRRADYVIRENNRVQQAKRALEQKDMQHVGELMYATHSGLSVDYEVSCAELDFLVKAAREVVGVLGARMMGGGFGGCTINLIEKDALSGFTAAMQEAWHKEYGKTLPIYATQISGGTQIVTF